MTATETLRHRIFDLLPAVFRAQDSNNAYEIFWDAVDDELRSWEAATIAPIRASQNLENCPESRLPYLAAKRGIRLPGYKIKNLRAFLINLPTLLRWKGNFRFIESAIFIATNILVQIKVPYQEPAFVVGVSSVDGDEGIGGIWKVNSEKVWAIGEGSVGFSSVGSEEINPAYPNTFQVIFQVIPTNEDLKVVQWIVDLFKRGEDIPSFIIPDTESGWTIGVSLIGVNSIVATGNDFEVDFSGVGSAPIAGPPVDVLRIILPNNTSEDDV